MSSIIRTYRHSPTYTADPTGTLVDTETDADDGAFSVTVETAGWSLGGYEITCTREDTTLGWAESLHSNALPLTAQGAFALASTTSNVASASGANVSVTPSSIPTGALVVALGLEGPATPVAYGTCTSANLSFTRRTYTMTANGAGRTELWTAVAGSDLTNEPITFDPTTSDSTAILTVHVFTGANTSTFNIVGQNDISWQSMLQNITCNASDSYVVGAFAQTVYNVTPTARSGTTSVQLSNGTTWTHWSVRSTDKVSGTVTIGDDGAEPYSDYAYLLVEVVAA